VLAFFFHVLDALVLSQDKENLMVLGSIVRVQGEGKGRVEIDICVLRSLALARQGVDDDKRNAKEERERGRRKIKERKRGKEQKEGKKRWKMERRRGGEGKTREI